MSQSGPGQREVAYRLFAAEFDDSDLSYSESDEERAPNYVVTPTGARVNRLFAVGVLTEVEDVNPEMVRGRIVDPTGAFVTYAGQYQPDALAFLERTEPPSFLAVSGKARTFEPDDGDRVYTSVRPESVSEVDAETRDKWIVSAAERTIERIEIMASAIESGLTEDRLEAALSAAEVDDRLAEGVALALDHYETTPAYLDALRTLAIDAVRVVAGEKEEAGQLGLAPDDGAGSVGSLSTFDLSVPDDVQAGTETATTADSGVEPETVSEPGPTQTEASESSSEEIPENEDVTPTEDEPIESSTTVEEGDTAEEEAEDVDPGEFELGEEERREVEEEYGTEFSTAGEVESGAETETAEPTSDEPEPEGESTTSDTEPTASATDQSPSDSQAAESHAETPETDSEAATPESEATESKAEGASVEEDIDLVDAVMETMERLGEDEGVDHDTLVSTVSDEHDVESEAVEEAIQDALMEGLCYEPTDGKLKSI